MSKIKAILSYARMPEEGLRKLRDGLMDLGIQVKWVTTHDLEQKKVKLYFPDVFHIKWASYRFNEPWNHFFDKELYDRLMGPKKDTVLPIVERYGPYEGGSMEAELRLTHDFSLAHHMIMNCQPKIIIFAKTPESGIEYCLYKLAKHFKIATLFTRMGAFPHSRVISTDIDYPILNKYWEPSIHTIPICNLEKPGNEMSRITEYKINELQNSQNNVIPDYMKNQGLSNLKKDFKYVQFKTNYTYIQLLKDFIKQGKGSYFKKQLLKENEKYATKLEEIDFEKRTYYFPLHYQPELTSMPVGNEFVNQLKIIKLLSQNLTINEQLLIKEHPSTLIAFGKTNSNFRPKSFYKWIQKMPNVKLVSAYVSSTYLMQNCKGVITISGTAGLEAIIKNIPVLVFGNASYLNGPGVFGIGKESDISEALRKIKSEIIKNDTVISFIKALDSVAHHLDDSPHEKHNNTTIMQLHYVNTMLEGLQKISI